MTMDGRQFMSIGQVQDQYLNGTVRINKIFPQVKILLHLF